MSASSWQGLASKDADFTDLARSQLRSLWILKGATCIKKYYFETYRFSEDLDFSLLPEALSTVNRNVAPTFLHNLVNSGQSRSCSILLGSEKWLKDLLQSALIHSVIRIADLQHHVWLEILGNKTKIIRWQYLSFRSVPHRSSAPVHWA